MRRVLKAVLFLIVLGLGALAWDVYQLRGLRPPPDATFASFAGPGSYRIGEDRIYWIAPPPRTLLPHAAPPVYAFDRRGALVDWTPGAEPGMRSGAPLRPGGREATLEQARAWLSSAR